MFYQDSVRRDGMTEIWTQDMKAKREALEKKKTEAVKKYRNAMKTARVAEQQERKQWCKRQQIIHSYGNQEEELTIEEEGVADSDSAVYSHIGGVHSTEGEEDEGFLIVMGHTTPETGEMSIPQLSRKGKARKPCKCGSTTHSRVSFHGCPLNKQYMST